MQQNLFIKYYFILYGYHINTRAETLGEQKCNVMYSLAYYLQK